ncbi:hypothetical protein HX882_04655 [Pseudomonas gingeri]|uniref:Acyltransferase 3 domain-containing protein n=1 Tax=Pseudomonas gingeri TaxID=117681 RepID=A0A7Y7X8E4_9PSED|nr:hypothetical protein [Pseudomonas gingeri]NWB95183.1 hypothetical protein [Pseudomonas gingeri]
MRTLADLFVGKNNNLTFIRLMAALSVFYGHTPAIVVGVPADLVTKTTGYAYIDGVAIDLFFLISAFLVTASILCNGLMRNHALFNTVFFVLFIVLWNNNSSLPDAIHSTSSTRNFLVASTIALLCGITSWHLVEKRARRLKKSSSGNLKLQYSTPT